MARMSCSQMAVSVSASALTHSTGDLAVLTIMFTMQEHLSAKQTSWNSLLFKPEHCILCSELVLSVVYKIQMHATDFNVDKECRIECANLQTAQGCCPTVFPLLKKGEHALRPVMKLLKSAQTINRCELWVATLKESVEMFPQIFPNAELKTLTKRWLKLNF